MLDYIEEKKYYISITFVRNTIFYSGGSIDE